MLRAFRPDVEERSVGLDTDQQGRLYAADRGRFPSQQWATVLGLGRQPPVMTTPKKLSALRGRRGVTDFQRCRPRERDD